MDAALAALIGAGLGAVGPFLSGVVNAGGERKRHREDLAEQRQVRLFEYRREAYLDFITAAQTALRQYLAWREDPTPESEVEMIAPKNQLLFCHGRISLYGSTKATDLGDKCWTAISLLIGDREAGERVSFGDAAMSIDDFAAQARVDLGVQEP